jgi:hypothetical protein
LFDLAYFKHRRFALIDENDGYFTSRLKQKANPLITGELQEWCGGRTPNSFSTNPVSSSVTHHRRCLTG